MSDRKIEPKSMPAKAKARGRPGTDVKAQARQLTAKAFERLVELMDDPNGCVAVAAVRIVVERAYGKVPVTHKHTGVRRNSKRVEPPAPIVKIARFHEESDHAD